MKRTAAELAVLMGLLDEALDLPEMERAGWLDSLDEQHGVLRDTLRTLLSYDHEAKARTLDDLGSRIAGILEAGLQFPDNELHEGAMIGSYRLDRELGRGWYGQCLARAARRRRLFAYRRAQIAAHGLD